MPLIDSIRGKIRVPAEAFVYLGNGAGTSDGYVGYEDLLARSSPDEPLQPVFGDDTWNIIYTSGTTGRPKGVVRTHEKPYGPTTC